MKRICTAILALCMSTAFALSAFAALPDDAQAAFDAALSDSDSQACKLLKDEVKTTSPARKELITLMGITYDGQSEEQLLNTADTGLYYVYEVAKNEDKDKSFNLLTCLYYYEGEYLVQSGEFDRAMPDAVEYAHDTNAAADILVVCKDAAFLVCRTDSGVTYYPTTERAAKISKDPCDFDTMAAGLTKLQSTDTQGFFNSENIKSLGLAMLVVGAGATAWQFIKAKRR